MAAALTLERTFCHPQLFGRGFNGGKASRVQRAICRVADGRPLGDLAADEVVQRVFGGAEAVAALPTIPPLEMYIIAAIRCGKSMFTAAMAVHTALTIDLSRIAKSEIARVAIVSLDRDKAAIVMQHIMGAMEGPIGQHLMPRPKPSTERIYLRRADGRVVEIVVAAGKRGGDNLVSRWTVAVVFDESARMLGVEDGVVNFDHMRAAVIERLRLLRQHGAMARLVAVSSPWAANGPMYDAVQEFFGRPTDRLVVVRATGPELCPDIWTPAACEAARNDPRGSYENDVLGEFIDPEAGWLTATDVRKATRSAPVERVPLPGDMRVRYVATMDPALTGNAWTFCVVGRESHPSGDDTKDTFHVALARQWQGTPANPLRAKTIFAEMRELMKPYRLREVYTDRWSGALLQEVGEDGGVVVNVSRDTPEQTAKNFDDFRILLVHDRLELAPIPALTSDLLSVRKKAAPGGAIRYVLPVSRDGRHADYAPACVLGIARLLGDADWSSAMAAHRARGGGPVFG
jgi:hypothetical protein